MTILIWHVECNGCNKVINAKEETFHEKDGEQFCNACWETI